MRLAIASGKGGTGKTTVAVNLAWTLSARGVAVSRRPIIFPELCRGCGGCAPACPAGAVREEPRPIGTVEVGRAGAIDFVLGRLAVGETLSARVIEAVKRKLQPHAVAILDAAPGTSCPVVAALRGSDYVVLVTEPTPFGLSDFLLAVDMVRKLGLPFGAAINRADSGYDRVRKRCERDGIPVIAELPDRREAAEAYARGKLLAEELPEFRDAFDRLWRALEGACRKAEARR